jgi:hypothetical protein
MTEEKVWWRSTTVITLAISAAIKLLVLAGFEAGIAAKYGTDIITYGLPLVGVCFDAFAAWRRVKSTTVLVAHAPPKPPEPTENLS